ncbi:radical SAM protein [Candidatus Pelagibacter sp.]|nr:radical SAM protein [Candidatus Pelagibacter sp.]
MTDALGSTEKRQESIQENVNLDKINNIYLSNLSFFKDFIKNSQDNYAKELFDQLNDNQKFDLPINKHMELFIVKNQKNFKKILKYIIFRYKFLKAGKDKVNLGYPPYLLVEPVSTCNLRCPFCFQTDKSFTKKPFMGVIDFDFFKKIIDQADKLETGAITIASRGEPTMHKKFIEMLEYINQKENIFEIKTNTNGTYLNEKMCHAIFENNVTQIVISSDHYIKEQYERLRLGSNFEKVVKNVDMLFNIRKKYYPHSLTEIRISGVDNEKNLDRKKFKEFWIQRSDHVTATYPLERWNTYENNIDLELKDPCENLWDRMYVWFDGKVNPCDADYKSYLSYGNAKEYSLKEIWDSKTISNLRDAHINKKRTEINPCDRCGVKFS